jgi:thymidylate synthase (FAD)
MNLFDHGYLNLITTWGSEEQIIEAARMSTNRGFKGWGGERCPECGKTDAGKKYPAPSCSVCKGTGFTLGDEKLLRYLYEHKHMTPFEMAGMTIEVQAPIFVFREWHRHRTQSYNELSARYTPLPAMDYMPTIERCLMVSGTNKQAAPKEGTEALTHETVLDWLEMLAALYEHAERVYQGGLQRGIPKEVARLSVTVGRYSRMRASANLRNWLQFLTLRMDAHAQYEIQMYANALGELMAKAFPRTWDLFLSGK